MLRRIPTGRLTAFGLPVIVLALSFPALRPLLSAGYPQGHDSLLHLLRLVEFHEMISDGYFYPRWFPDLALGYGYPLLNYYPPFFYYVAEAWHLAGFGFIHSIELTIALSVLVSGLGMYVYVNYITSRRSLAFLAAIAYIYLPYRLVDIYIRGAFPEAVSFIFPPFLLVSFHALAAKGRTAHLLSSGLLLAGLLVSHQIALFFVPLLLLYAVVVAALSSAPGRRIRLILLATVAGFLASSFYWLPALTEQRFASTDNIALMGNSPEKKLMDLADLFDRGFAYTYGDLPFKMDLVGAILAVAGLVCLGLCLRKSLKGRRDLLPLLVFPASAVLFVFLMVSPAALFWEKMPLVNSIQFPWRLLSLVGLSVALCVSFLATPKRLGPYIALSASGVLILAATLSLSPARINLTDDDLSIAEVTRWEYHTGVVGTSYEAEWLPAVARSGYMPHPSTPLPPPPPEGLPPLDKATIQRTGPLAYRLVVSAAQATSVRLHAFAFPGWQAKLDGRDTVVYPAPPLGTVAVDVPSGDHTLDLSFGETPARQIATLLSSAALLLLAVFCVARARKARESYSYYSGILLVPVVISLSLVNFSPKAPPVLGENLRPASQRPVEADFGDRLRLLGFELQAPTSGNGWEAEATLYWQPLRPLSGEVSASLEWVDLAGTITPAGTGWPLFDASPARTWSSNEIVRDLRRLRLPAQPLPEAKLRLTVWEDDKKLGTTELGTVYGVPASSAKPSPQGGASVLANFANRIGLAGYSVQAEGVAQNSGLKARKGVLAEVKPGDKLRVNLDWQSLSETNLDYRVFVHLYTRKLTLVSQYDDQPQNGLRPTSTWQSGDIVQDSHPLSIPQVDQPGIYRLATGLYNLKTLDRLEILGDPNSAKVLGEIKIAPPPAKLNPSNKLEATFGGALSLEGYDLSGEKSSADPGSKGKVALSLYWRADGEVDKDYKVFVHLVDGNGKVIAQQDGEPVDDSYPTSYWSKGEEIRDGHEIAVSAEELAKVQQIEIGLYDPATGQRLITDTGADSLSLPALIAFSTDVAGKG